jgi:NAD(P)-dependent dehydrogenase (short-subunit alcohol dehydrogenase family)
MSMCFDAFVFTLTPNLNLSPQGGAGGLGRAFSRALLLRGFAGVGILDVQGHEAFAEELRREFGSRAAVAFRCDVTNPASVRAAYDAVHNHYGGRLDVVVNNAGIAVPLFEDVERHVGVNLLGVVYGTREGCRLLNPEGDFGGRGGSIINIASIAGIVPVQFSPVYAATKAAVVNLSR